jgi:site-specific DNA recombinase
MLIVEGLDRPEPRRRRAGPGRQAPRVPRHPHHRHGDGYDTQARGRKVMRVARGLVNELYLDDLREKTHRGLAGQFDRGYHVGGVCYGYRSRRPPTAAAASW